VSHSWLARGGKLCIRCTLDPKSQHHANQTFERPSSNLKTYCALIGALCNSVLEGVYYSALATVAPQRISEILTRRLVSVTMAHKPVRCTLPKLIQASNTRERECSPSWVGMGNPSPKLWRTHCSEHIRKMNVSEREISDFLEHLHHSIRVEPAASLFKS
jgi:hypothetical protein